MSAFQLFQRVRAPLRRLLVCDVVFEGSLPRDPDSVPVARFGAFMTSLITVGYALRFAFADATADLEYTERNLCEDVKGRTRFFSTIQISHRAKHCKLCPWPP